MPNLTNAKKMHRKLLKRYYKLNQNHYLLKIAIIWKQKRRNGTNISVMFTTKLAATINQR